jgi:hypothetical protein
MDIAEIDPIARADKLVLTISAEKNGKLRVTLLGWTMPRLRLFSIGLSWSGRG